MFFVFIILEDVFRIFAVTFKISIRFIIWVSESLLFYISCFISSPRRHSKIAHPVL